MDNKEAIQYIIGHCLGPDADRDGTAWNDAMMTAIEALEKQIPKRNLEKCQYNENLFALRCPTCGALIANYNKRLKRYDYMVRENYCCICGQAIDYSKPQQEEQDG